MTTTPRQSTEPAGAAPSSGAQVAASESVQETAQESALLQELADVLHQVRRGRFDVRLPRRAGSPGELVDQVNDLVALLERRNRDILRISRTVGREGRMSERLNEEAYDGAWAHGVQAVNALIDDLAAPTAEIARVIEAVAEGDLSQHMALEIEGRPLRGEFRRIGRTVNTMVDQLSSFADEVTRVAREVGTEGMLGGQADVRGVAGTWRALTDSVNAMASNLTNQVRSISSAATAVAKGDLSRKITVSARGEIAELADTINSLTDTLRLFADEVTRVAVEVGTEGRLGGQATVPNVAGTWKNLTDAVNLMAANLTNQVRGIAQVAAAVKSGDLSQKITVDARGEILELKSTVNTMVDQLSSFADEVTRVAREVGTEGKLGGQAAVPTVSGTWRDLTENVNQLAGNLTAQVRNIAQVTTAVARGDLSQKITVDARGEILELKSTVNTMVDQLSSFADEVTRVAREVGTEGKLGGQAEVQGVAGTWRDLTDNVNYMASNLTDQVRNIAQVTTAVAQGDLSQKITVDARGEILELKSTVNTMVDQLSSFADEVTRVAREVGTEGKLGGQAEVKGVAGTWRDLTENVNQLAGNLTAQVRNIAQVTTAVAQGDLSQKITVDAKGEILEFKDTVNTMVDQLSSFADEVTRVAREVGTEGKLGGQATVKGVAGTWRDLTENVNQLAGNLTAQVRNIAQVTTAVARGDLSQKMTVDARGEILDLKLTVNTMVDQLSSFADEVSRVAREVGTEGKLGGQAEVKGVAGTWRGLTENVNQLAATLTTQLRAISAVSTAVASGDLTQQITVAARGEIADLKDTINQMIAALRATTTENADQSWLDSNLVRIGGLLQGQRDLNEVCQMIMNEVAPLVNAQVGAFFLAAEPSIISGGDPDRWVMCGGYAMTVGDPPLSFGPGEGLVGQAAVTRQVVLVENLPADYLPVRSAVGAAPPRAVVVLPVQFEGECLGVIELGSVVPFSALHLTFLERLVATIGVAITTIRANRRTEELLSQSQVLAMELQDQSAELQRANAELEEKAEQLSQQNRNVEIKNMEIDAARRGVEEKAQQLALASQYKSEFLANMSHELRTPLNSLLLLARLLADNPNNNLTEKQIEFASTIHSAGSDLLRLIDDILDLSKIESGRVDVDPAPVNLAQVCSSVEQAFRPQAEEKGLEMRVEASTDLPAAITTDEQRLQQVLRNLLANAVKFTDSGHVSLGISVVPPGTLHGVPALDSARTVIAFTVGDTGIGIPQEKLEMIFEAFQQADGTTSRKYGGTGLGLSISKELARMLGGKIEVTSRPGEGSVFTLLLPDELPPVTAAAARMTPRPPIPALALPESTVEQPRPAAMSNPILRTGPGGPTGVRPAPELAGVTVLIVDDDVRNVFALTSALELHGLTVIYADNGAEGIRLLTEHPEIDVVLMDAMMPDLDGNETTRRIRRLPQGRDLPIVFLTAKAMPGDRESSLAAGATDYVTKPVDLDELLALMASWVTPRRGRTSSPGGGSFGPGVRAAGGGR
ncbi:HAMP domain-containing protein [Pseudonocardia cypriaca]|uniref:Circadian input-output histidine kinase CikA n=1 Tax=Pseudonocardia cypriaca TaxID=882449 RepID=A0A543GH05_9PSEU|nr:HAMP domain-containing protein [Pseudonocardia cypriaca]TQM45362.1 signal transduction histidine kinase [Pseudonocardia cypriaca]